MGYFPTVVVLHAVGVRRVGGGRCKSANIDANRGANIDTSKIIFMTTLYVFCVSEFTKYKDNHRSKKLRIFNEKYTDSIKTTLFK